MQTTISDNDLIYLRISKNIEQQILSNVLKPGDKLPSLRAVCRQQGVSMSSALQAYLTLETKGLIMPRPQSGYFVSYTPKKLLQMPETSKPAEKYSTTDSEAIVAKVYSELGTKTNVSFSLGVPAKQLLPIAKLNKALMQAVRDLPGSGTSYEMVQGNQKLRRQIARGSFTWKGNLDETDIITTSGCMSALACSLLSVAGKGDTIAVESPVYFGVLRLAKSLGLNILELPTHPQTGIDPEALKKVIAKKKIKVCLLISNFSNPLGSCMPDEHKKEVVKLMEKHNIPLIEDDLYGDIFFGHHRPTNCKTYDESGIVLWCGSVSKTLAPGYRVGWVAPGKFKGKVLRAKLYHSIAPTTVTHEAIGNFLETGSYEKHLRTLRQQLHTNYLNYLKTIETHFPDDTRVSRPQGGFMLWLKLNKKINSIKLFDVALQHKISIAPGSMFTMQKQYTNCIRLSYGLDWNEKTEGALKTLGKLIKQMI